MVVEMINVGKTAHQLTEKRKSGWQAAEKEL